MSAFGEIWQPLPRWASLPGDPAPLRAWLRAQAAKDETTTEQLDNFDAHNEDEGRAA